MKAILGFAVTSLSLVADYIRTKDRSIKCFIPIGMRAPTEKELQICKESEILLFSSVAMLKRFVNHLDNKVVLVFDSPINLCHIDGITFVDCERNSTLNSLSYRFAFCKPKFSIIFSKLKNKRNIKFGMDKVDLLPTIIEGKVNGGIMEVVNNLIYNSTNPTNRLLISNYIYSWSMGVLTAKKCQASIKKILVLNYVREKILKDLFDYMTSDYGKNIILAMQEREKQRKEKKPVQYTKLEKQFNIKKDDIKGLVSLGGNQTDDEATAA